MSAFDAKFGVAREYRAAITAGSLKRACAFFAKLRSDTIFVLACGALHRTRLPKSSRKKR
jgi:hypothetical protein